MISNLINMTESEIKSKLIRLIMTAYFGSEFRKEYLNFSIVFRMEHLQTQFGQYDMVKREIEVSNPSPNVVDQWKTLIHECSHHIDCCQRGTSDHGPKFFAIYKKLLWTAMDLDWFSPEYLVLATAASADHNKMVQIIDEYKKMLQKR